VANQLPETWHAGVYDLVLKTEPGLSFTALQRLNGGELILDIYFSNLLSHQRLVNRFCSNGRDCSMKCPVLCMNEYVAMQRFDNG